MPIYEYRCPECGHEFEKMMKISSTPPPCPECEAAETRKMVSASSFVLKGSGWYRDHYGLKSGGGDGGSSGSSGSTSGGGDGGSSGSSGSTSGGGGGE